MNNDEEEIAVIFSNLFNAVHAFTNLQMELILLIRYYQKKKKYIQNNFLLETNYKQTVTKRKNTERKYWIRPGKDRYWWENFASRNVVEEEWRKNFRMSRETFEILCAELYCYIFKNDARFQNAVPVDKQVAVTLYYLSDEGCIRKAANAFGIGKITASTIIS